jgi:DNA-dependent RNA polymerase auxiliary subunit epsilon
MISGYVEYFKNSETNIPLRFKENSFNFNFITLIAGLRDQIVKYTTRKHQQDIAPFDYERS